MPGQGTAVGSWDYAVSGPAGSIMSMDLDGSSPRLPCPGPVVKFYRFSFLVLEVYLIWKKTILKSDLSYDAHRAKLFPSLLLGTDTSISKFTMSFQRHLLRILEVKFFFLNPHRNRYF